MPSRKPTVRGKPPVKRLLDEVIRSKAVKPKIVVINLVNDCSQSQSQEAAKVSDSSSMLKRHEEKVKKNDGVTWSPDPTLPSAQPALQQQQQQQPQVQQLQQGIHQPRSANTPFFYSSMYRRYFGLTPPNPALCNPRLLEDYIDWYINVYLQEELPWHSINIGAVAERVKQSEDEAREEAEKLAASNSATSKDKQ